MKILIADDESIIRMGLKSMLAGLGHEVMAAVNGREALQMTRRQEFDLAILDIKMPYTDGLQAAKTIARTQPMPIIMLTAFGDDELIEKASELPIHGYLIKPVAPAELSAAIQVAYKRFAEQQVLAKRAVQLYKTLEMRKTVERAKGKLMENGMTEEEAYHQIQRTARDSGQSMHAVALAILGE
ncbi:MAG: response regulator [Chloroflexi bacterium]|nr:MAG: response regulator [Chloroflexota bacterium]PIE79663.1 MAG: response regulator [Chloroflexota bacterium]